MKTLFGYGTWSNFVSVIDPSRRRRAPSMAAQCRRDVELSVARRDLRGTFCAPTGPLEAGSADGPRCAEKRRHEDRWSTVFARIPEVCCHHSVDQSPCEKP